MKFQDAIVEYRYFDNNMQPVESREQAAAMVGRTEGSYYGDKWHAIDLKGHWNLGNSKNIEDVMQRVSVLVTSDEAEKAEIEFVDEGYQDDGRRKTWGVHVNGERVGHFRPNWRSNDYRFIDRSDRAVHTDAVHPYTHMEARTKGEFETVVRHWFELIPTQADIELRELREREEREREEAEQAEAQRIATIKDAGVELYEAAVRLMALPLDVTAERNKATRAMRAAIAKAEGRTDEA